MDELERTPLFTALTRPQMFAGVTYNYFIINAVIAAELFLIFRSVWVLAAALIIHGIGFLLRRRESLGFYRGSAAASPQPIGT